MKKLILVIVMLTSFHSMSASADLYVLAGVGNTSAETNVAKIGLGYVLTPWLRLEADYMRFGTSSESGMIQSVGPLVLDSSGTGYTCAPIGTPVPPCHNENTVMKVQSNAKSISLKFTTEEDRTHLYSRVGIIQRTDNINVANINVYNAVDFTFYTPPNTVYSNKTTHVLLGLGINFRGFGFEIDYLGKDYPGNTIYGNHDLMIGTISYDIHFN